MSWRGGWRVRTVQSGHLHGEEILGRGLSLLLPLLCCLAPGTATTNISAGNNLIEISQLSWPLTGVLYGNKKSVINNFLFVFPPII